MKRCPSCRRDYFDESLLFCLDDGTLLVEGPANPDRVIFDPTSRGRPDTEPATRILREGRTRGRTYKAATLIAIAAGVLVLSALAVYQFSSGATVDPASEQAKQPVPKPKLYWEMSTDEQLEMVQKRSADIFSILGDEATELSTDELLTINQHLNRYAARRDNVSQKPWEEGLRTIYGRASQYASLIGHSFEARKVPPVLGIYQAMIESEYRDCPTHPHPRGPVGLFQFSRKTAARYDLNEADYCDVLKQSDAAARHVSDLLSDFGIERASWTLALLGFNNGTEMVRYKLRSLRANGITERDFWAIWRYRDKFDPPLTEDDLSYVPRFFAAAIIGETPEVFDIPVPPLTTLR